MKKLTYEQGLTIIMLVLIGICIGLFVCFGTEHHKRVQYEQAACVLADVVHSTIDHERDSNMPMCDEMYGEIVENLDCYNVTIDKNFVENLSWAY